MSYEEAVFFCAAHGASIRFEIRDDTTTCTVGLVQHNIIVTAPNFIDATKAARERLTHRRIN